MLLTACPFVFCLLSCSLTVCCFHAVLFPCLFCLFCLFMSSALLVLLPLYFLCHLHFSLFSFLSLTFLSALTSACQSHLLAFLAEHRSVSSLCTYHVR